MLNLNLFRRYAVRSLAGCLFALGISAAALSQQIPCPVTGTTINVGAATNALNPCEITAGATLTNSSSGTLENQAGATLLNDSGATLINNSTLSGSLLNDPGATITNNGLLTNNGFITSGSSPTMISTINNTGTFNGTGTIFTSGTVNNSGNFNNVLFTFAATINNTGGTLVLFNGSTINGGTLNNVSGTLGPAGTILLNGSTGDGPVTIQGTYTGDVGSTTQINGTIINQGNIQLNGNGLLELVGNTALEGGGTVTLGGAGSAIVSSGSTVTLTNANNTIQGAGQLFGLLINNLAPGIINANIPGPIVFDATNVTNDGLIEATGGGSLALNGGTKNNSGGSILIDALSGASNHNLLTNNGVLTIAGTLDNNAGGIQNAGTTQILSGGKVTGSGGTYRQTAGSTQVDGSLQASQVIIEGGVLKGSGVITTNINVALLTGSIQPGSLTAPLTINGSYDQFGTFDELIGTTGNGLLVVNGTSTLEKAALLNIDLLAGFTPALGENFILMDYFSNSGEFANAPTTGFVMDGFNWTIDYNPSDIVLIAGSAVGGGGGGGGGGTGVPEPSSVLLLASGLASLGFLRRRFLPA